MVLVFVTLENFYLTAGVGLEEICNDGKEAEAEDF
jgi:hypothetical protein